MIKLTPREAEVLRRIGFGSTVSDIGRELGLSVKTISTYRARILEKLHLPNTPSLIRYAIVQGISPAPEIEARVIELQRQLRNANDTWRED